jgi:transmembrane sensor
MGLKQGGKDGGNLQASEEAAVWLQRLREHDTPEVRAEFSAWVRKGAVNLEEFLFAQATWKELDYVDPDMRKRLWSVEGPETVVDFPVRERLSSDGVQSGKAQRRNLHRSWLISAAAMLAVVMIGWATLITSHTHATDIGEQRSVKLADGSIMYLNTSSRAVVDFTDTQRTIRLTSGEALFMVEHDPRRPFYVLTDSARIRAIGTEFNVYRNNDGKTRVAVIEGVVQVSPVRRETAANTTAAGGTPDVQLAAGDEASVDMRHVAKSREPNIERAVAWRSRRLMFSGDPVSAIAAEFNRYNETPIRIEGDELLTRRMSGVFDADDPAPLVQYLQDDPTIEVVRSEGEILIRARAASQ